MDEQTVINVVNVEINRLNLQPGEVLMVTLKSEETDMSFLSDFRNGIQKLLPNNKVGVIGLNPKDSLQITIVKPEETSYCSDCTCGKKEQV